MGPGGDHVPSDMAAAFSYAVGSSYHATPAATRYSLEVFVLILMPEHFAIRGLYLKGTFI